MNETAAMPFFVLTIFCSLRILTMLLHLHCLFNQNAYKNRFFVIVKCIQMRGGKFDARGHDFTV
jgi:hypothetical protein